MVKADTQPELRSMLLALRQQYNESGDAFGARLGPFTGTQRPYSSTYIYLLEQGKRRVPAIVARALHILAKQQVMVHPAAGVQLTPGCIVQRPERICRRNDCGVHFVPEGEAQYCSDICRRAGARNRNIEVRSRKSESRIKT